MGFAGKLLCHKEIQGLLQLNGATFLADRMGSDGISTAARFWRVEGNLLTAQDEDDSRCRPGK